MLSVVSIYGVNDPGICLFMGADRTTRDDDCYMFMATNKIRTAKTSAILSNQNVYIANNSLNSSNTTCHGVQISATLNLTFDWACELFEIEKDDPGVNVKYGWVLFGCEDVSMSLHCRAYPDLLDKLCHNSSELESLKPCHRFSITDRLIVICTNKDYQIDFCQATKNQDKGECLIDPFLSHV